jgi:hypothetical protein
MSIAYRLTIFFIVSSGEREFLKIFSSCFQPNTGLEKA